MQNFHAASSMFFCACKIKLEFQVKMYNSPCTYFSIVEERIHAPWIGFYPPVEVWICRNLRKVTVVLMFQVLQMFCVLCFGVIHPGYASCN